MALGRRWQALAELLNIPGTVYKEGSAWLYILRYIELLNIGGVMAGDKVRLGDIVGGLDGLITEAQVRYGYAARLLRVVLEVRLYLLPCDRL